MTYTSHGHHIPGSPEDFGDELPKARCGGPGLCGVCTSQSTAWRTEADRLGVLAELDAAKPQHEGLLVPGLYQSKIVSVRAIQFIGGAANGMDIVAWINAFGGNATWRNQMDPWQSEDGLNSHPGIPEMLTIQTPDSRFLEASVGWWIIQGTQGEFYPVSNDAFHEKYEEFKE
jgi:hypothetical protein